MRLRDAVFLVGACVFSLGVAEAVFRSLPDHVVGFQYVDGFFRPPGDLSVDLTKNAQGFHDVEHGQLPDGTTRLLLLGDSFVHGIAVEVEQTVGQRLAAHLTSRTGRVWDVAAVGGPGWSLEGEQSKLVEYGPRLAPDWVVTLFYSGNDVSAASPLLQRRYRKEMREIRSEPSVDHIPAANAKFLWAPASALNRFVSYRLTRRAIMAARDYVPMDFLVLETPVGPEFEAAWQGVEQAIVATAETAAALGARYAVVATSTPWGVQGESGLEALLTAYPAMRGRSWDLDQPDERMRALCARNGIPFLPLGPVFREETARGARLHGTWDRHWSAAGHDLAGAEIAAFVAALEP